jgi:hypothetical protein
MDSLRKDVVARDVTIEQLNSQLMEERAEKVNIVYVQKEDVVLFFVANSYCSVLS